VGLARDAREENVGGGKTVVGRRGVTHEGQDDPEVSVPRSTSSRLRWATCGLAEVSARRRPQEELQAESTSSRRPRRRSSDDLKKAAEKVDALYVATDPDREGEAIGWHLAEELDVAKKNVYRITFNEITERAVKAAFTQPGRSI
jgi:DNA topoisomerase IA